jgi:inner membrane protein YidH
VARFPRWVYQQGEEPDPRFSLANERTFLAWIRTSLALFAAGVALEALRLPVAARWRLAGAAVFVALGLLAAVQAWLGWARTELAMRRATPLPGPSLSLLISAGVVVGVVLVVVGLWLR